LSEAAFGARLALDADTHAGLPIHAPDIDSGLRLTIAAVEVDMIVPEQPGEQIADQSIECLPVARTIEAPPAMGFEM